MPVMRADSVSKSGSGVDFKDSAVAEGLDAEGEGFVAVWRIDVEGVGGGDVGGREFGLTWWMLVEPEWGGGGKGGIPGWYDRWFQLARSAVC